MDYTNFSKRELIKILESVQRIVGNQPPKQHSLALNGNDVSTNSQNDLEYLIGTIPFLLLNQEIFEKNQDIADFANKLNIFIPSPEKKKREDIIGRVVSAIAKIDNKNIEDLNIAIKTIKKTDIKKGKTNFFKDWENVIKQIEI